MLARTLVHWAHLTAAVAWVGGTLAVALAAQPAMKEALDEPSRRRLYRALGRRLSALQWWSWAILGATGAWKLWGPQGPLDPWAGPYGRVLILKLALVAAMAALSLLHGLRWGPALLEEGLDPRERARLARRAAFWGRANAALMLGILLAAAALRGGL